MEINVFCGILDTWKENLLEYHKLAYLLSIPKLSILFMH